MRSPWIVVSACLGSLVATGEVPAWIEKGLDWAGKLGASDVVVTIPSQQDLTALWSSLDTSLHANSWEKLAALKPQAETALEYLDRWPQARPYADWLRQRIDYLDVAEQVLQSEKTAPPPPAPPAPLPPVPPARPTGTNKPPPVIFRPQTPVPPAPPSTATPRPTTPPAHGVARSRTARSTAVWQRKLARRQAPRDAQALVPGMKSIFRAQGIPEQLVWLAEVESTMDPSARSPAGAVGLFQMMPATAQRFGLSLKPDDERLQPDKQAVAACKCLKFLYGRFKSWPLALAGYNAGEGRIGKALKETGGKDFDDIAPTLSIETQMYVPKIAALLKLREGADLERLPAPRG